ncbi:MAG TPA: HAMP domain-containing sensor histidine kinase [Vicinamibacterales bacterium]|nr:HAMP domain-containing sensor histidine kinase [Vicinamibacterales bacterium]
MPRPLDIDRAAFHRHMAEINGRRIPVLAGVTALLCAISFAANVASGGLSNFSLLTGTGLNVTAMAMAAVVYGTYRWLRMPGLSAILYGCLVLAWGDLMIPTYLHEIEIKHSAHAAQNLVIYFITRYLAAVSVVWRPRDLAIVLVLNHAVSLWPLVATQGLVNAYLFTALWTATAWLVAFLIYRAERDAFIARLRLQEQRDALASANANLERLNQEKNDLMAIAAHDLRSPLMGMTTLLSMAADEASRAWAAGVGTLKALEESGRNMAELVTRVLDAHQTDDRLGQLAVVAGDIAPVVTRTLAPHDAVARAKGITLTVHAPEPCIAMHDPHALGRVIDNLGSNAIKFSPPGATVRVAVLPAENGGGPRIQISDGGPGISEAERPRLFRKFARLRAKPTAGESSSGLGLYIVKRLVDAMGGTIDVTAADGGGASFIVTLRPQTLSESPGSVSH